MKKCKSCKQTLINASFDESKRSKDGLKSKCKFCADPKSSDEKFCSQRIGCDCGCMDSMADGLTIAQRESGYYPFRHNVAGN